jgi:hypothetical protein
VKARLRTPRLAGGVADSVGVRPGEKVVAWGVNGQEYTLATTKALYANGDRIPWHRVSKATWSEPELVVFLLDGEPARRIELEDARDLPPAVRDRVTDSVIVSEHVELDGEAGARMVARRDSDDGSVRWSVVFDSGLDPNDERLRGAADAALTRLRSALGV